MSYPVSRNCCRNRRRRAFVWHCWAMRLRSCRHSDRAMAWAIGWRGAATANTTCNNRRTSGTVMVVPGFSPQPAFLQHQKPQRQHRQRLVVVPAPPAPHLIFIESHFALAPQEAVLHGPAAMGRLGHHPERAVRGGITEVILD